MVSSNIILLLSLLLFILINFCCTVKYSSISENYKEFEVEFRMKDGDYQTNKACNYIELFTTGKFGIALIYVYLREKLYGSFILHPLEVKKIFRISESAEIYDVRLFIYFGTANTLDPTNFNYTIHESLEVGNKDCVLAPFLVKPMSVSIYRDYFSEKNTIWMSTRNSAPKQNNLVYMYTKCKPLDQFLWEVVLGKTPNPKTDSEPPIKRNVYSGQFYVQQIDGGRIAYIAKVWIKMKTNSQPFYIGAGVNMQEVRYAKIKSNLDGNTIELNVEARYVYVKSRTQLNIIEAKLYIITSGKINLGNPIRRLNFIYSMDSRNFVINPKFMDEKLTALLYFRISYRTESDGKGGYRIDDEKFHTLSLIMDSNYFPNSHQHIEILKSIISSGEKMFVKMFEGFTKYTEDEKNLDTLCIRKRLNDGDRIVIQAKEIDESLSILKYIKDRQFTVCFIPIKSFQFTDFSAGIDLSMSKSLFCQSIEATPISHTVHTVLKSADVPFLTKRCIDYEFGYTESSLSSSLSVDLINQLADRFEYYDASKSTHIVTMPYQVNFNLLQNQLLIKSSIKSSEDNIEICRNRNYPLRLFWKQDGNQQATLIWSSILGKCFTNYKVLHLSFKSSPFNSIDTTKNSYKSSQTNGEEEKVDYYAIMAEQKGFWRKNLIHPKYSNFAKVNCFNFDTQIKIIRHQIINDQVLLQWEFPESFPCLYGFEINEMSENIVEISESSEFRHTYIQIRNSKDKTLMFRIRPIDWSGIDMSHGEWSKVYAVDGFQNYAIKPFSIFWIIIKWISISVLLIFLILSSLLSAVQ